MHDPMPLLIKKKPLNFWKDSRQRRRGGSTQGPLGPTNLEASVLLNELASLLEVGGSKYKLYILCIIQLGMDS